MKRLGLMAAVVVGILLGGRAAVAGDLTAALANLKQIETKMWGEFDQTAESKHAKDWMKKSQGILSNARATAIEKLGNTSPDYRIALKEKNALKDQLEQVRHEREAKPSEIEKLAADLLKAGLRVNAIEQKALEGDSGYGEAMAEVNKAKANMGLVRQQYDVNVIQQNAEWKAARQAVEDARAKSPQ